MTSIFDVNNHHVTKVFIIILLLIVALPAWRDSHHYLWQRFWEKCFGNYVFGFSCLANPTVNTKLPFFGILHMQSPTSCHRMFDWMERELFLISGSLCSGQNPRCHFEMYQRHPGSSAFLGQGSYPPHQQLSLVDSISPQSVYTTSDSSFVGNPTLHGNSV